MDHSRPPPSTRLDNPEAWFLDRIAQFFQSVFRDRKEGEFRWDANESTTEIVITDLLPVPLIAVQRVPHIQLVPGGFQNLNLSFDQMVDMDIRTGERLHADLFSGSIMLYVHAKEDETTRRIARICAYETMQRKRTLMQHARLHLVGHLATVNPSVSPASLISGESEVRTSTTSLVLPFYFAEAWRTRRMRIPAGKVEKTTGLNPLPGTERQPLYPLQSAEVQIDSSAILASEEMKHRAVRAAPESAARTAALQTPTTVTFRRSSLFLRGDKP